MRIGWPGSALRHMAQRCYEYRRLIAFVLSTIYHHQRPAEILDTPTDDADRFALIIVNKPA